MKAYMAFTRKEFTEFTRTYKLMILGLVFLFFGIMSLWQQNTCLKSSVSSCLPGWRLHLPPQRRWTLDAVLQKRITAGPVGGSHSLWRHHVLRVFQGHTNPHADKRPAQKNRSPGKVHGSVPALDRSYLLCFGTAYGYTWYYWRADAGMEGLYAAIAATWLYGIFLLSITILGSVLFRNSYGCLLFTGIAVVLQILLNMIPKIKEFNPMELITEGTPLLQGQVESTLFLKPTVVGCIGTLICVTLSCIIFNKKKL